MPAQMPDKCSDWNKMQFIPFYLGHLAIFLVQGQTNFTSFSRSSSSDAPWKDIVHQLMYSAYAPVQGGW